MGSKWRTEATSKPNDGWPLWSTPAPAPVPPPSVVVANVVWLADEDQTATPSVGLCAPSPCGVGARGHAKWAEGQSSGVAGAGEAAMCTRDKRARQTAKVTNPKKANTHSVGSWQRKK